MFAQCKGRNLKIIRNVRKRAREVILGCSKFRQTHSVDKNSKKNSCRKEVVSNEEFSVGFSGKNRSRRCDGSRR